MNVHYISGISVASDGAGGWTGSNAGADLSVYDDCFDHFQYDVGHLKKYSPTANKKTHAAPAPYKAPSNPYQNNYNNYNKPQQYKQSYNNGYNSNNYSS